jgi:acyl-coenzyme A synthetase/AMP-(fatty) acid ligase
VPALPRTAMGKLRQRDLRDRYGAGTAAPDHPGKPHY